MAESQNIEWKRSWKDEYLKWVCGFANAKGGKIYIGKDDDGSLYPLQNAKRLLEEIPNKIKSLIGLTVDVNLSQTKDGDFLIIDVLPQSVPVSLRGRYYYRTGSTKIELTGASLNEFLLKKAGSTWDASIESRADLEDIDLRSIDQFLSDARTANRLPDANGLPLPDLLTKLRLLTNGQFTCAALILFGKDPARLYPGLSIRIGRFGTSDTDLRFQEVVEGNLIYCLKETLSLLASKFLIKPVRFEGIQRIEEDQYPLPALREALLNALVHRRYQSGVHVQIRVYDHRLVIWNDGPLPDELPVSALLQQHSSRPRNPLIADACFKAGYIDSWGRGIEKITEACAEAKLPAPSFEDVDGGFRVTLTSRISEGAKPSSEGGTTPTEGVTSANEGDPNIAALQGYFTAQGHRPRQDALTAQLKILRQLVYTPQTHAAELADAIGMGKSTAERHLAVLKKLGLVNLKGRGKSRSYLPTELAHQYISKPGTN